MSENRIRKVITSGTTANGPQPGYGPHSAGVWVDGSTKELKYNADGTVRVALSTEVGSSAPLTAEAAEINRNVDMSARVITITVSTTLTSAAAEGRTIVMSSTTGLTVTLPSVGTASGGKYRIMVGTVQTGGPYKVVTAGATEIFAGSIVLSTTLAAGASAFPTTAGSVTISLNGTTTGGASLGDVIMLESFKSSTWSVSGQTVNTGTAATPFTT